MLREALASNTIGGRAGEETKWRAMAEDVRQAQAAWSRLGPVPGEAGRELTERFHKACNRFFDQYRRKVPPQQQTSQRERKPVGTREIRSTGGRRQELSDAPLKCRARTMVSKKPTFGAPTLWRVTIIRTTPL